MTGPERLADVPLLFVKDLAVFLGEPSDVGAERSFTGLLLALFMKADPARYRRLSAAFPEEARALEAWRRMQPAPTWGELRDYLARPLPCDSSSL